MKRKILISLVLSSILIEPIGATILFKASDSSGGSELWKSDGSETGTTRVKDIYSGMTGSYPNNLSVVGDTLFFSANDGVSGEELWKSDGSETGTVKVKDIYSGATSSSPSNFVALGSTLYFSADDGVSGNELWKSDGSESGTVMIKDIWSGSTGSTPTNLIVFNNKIYFSATDSSEDSELWVSDGSESGTVRLKDIYTGGSSNPANFVVIGSNLFFSATDEGGLSIWKSDGSEAGTTKIIPSNSTLSNLTNINGRLYFTTTNGSDIKIWRTNDTATDSELVTSIASNYSTATSPNHLTAIEDTLFFDADTNSYGDELWESNGSNDGTNIIKDIYTGSTNSSPYSSSPNYLTALGDTLYFSAEDGSNGVELWESNGSSDGTSMLKDINSGSGNSSPSNLIVIDGVLYFSANDGTNGVELWKSDGTSSGTVMIKDIYSSGDSSPSLFTKYAVIKASIDKNSHNFGTIEVGSTASQIFTISNIGTLDLSINSISLSDNSNFVLNSSCNTISVGSSCAFTITYSPTSDSLHSGVVTINTNSTNGNDLTILLNGSGYSTYIPTEDYNIVDTTNISEEDFGNTFFEDETTFNDFIDNVSENFGSFDEFKGFLDENLNYSIPKDAKLSFNENKNFVIKHPSESFEDGSNLAVSSEIITSGENIGLAQTSMQLTSETNEEIASATFETNRDVNVKVSNGEVTNSVNTQIEVDNRAISKANLSATIKSTRKELSTKVTLKDNYNLNLEREVILPTIGDSNTKIDKIKSESSTKVEIVNNSRSSKLQSTRKEFFTITHSSDFKTANLTVSANIETEDTLLRGKMKTTKQVALFSTRREFSNVKLEVLFDNKNARELREKQKVSSGKFKATYSTRSEFSFKNNNSREISEVKIIPDSNWQRYEEVQSFDGIRSIKLVLGRAKIVIDGKEEEMIKDKVYTLPSIITETPQTTIESNLYMDGKLQLINGWNLITTPVDKDINSSELKAVTIWSYIDEKWNNSVNLITPNLGYWVNMENNHSIAIEGSEYEVDLSGLNEGWNLIGTGKSFEVNISNTILKYSDSNWSINPSIIYQGEGFWIKK